MPDTATVNKFPSALNSADSLGRAKNGAVTRLVAGISPDDTTFAVEDGDLLAVTGVAVLQKFEQVEVEGIVTLLPVSPAEIITFERVDDQLVNVLRHREGTAARTWDAGDYVGMNPTAGLWDARAAAQMAVEAKLGTGASTAALGQYLRGTGPGASVWSAIQATDIPDLSAAYAPAAHTHSIANVTGLQGALDAKASLTALNNLAASLAAVALSGQYNDLLGKPTLFSGAYADLTGKPTLFSGAYSDLTGKPTLGTGAALNVAASGDAASGEVVRGSDTRLTNARTPTSHTHSAADLASGRFDAARLPAEGLWNVNGATGFEDEYLGPVRLHWRSVSTPENPAPSVYHFGMEAIESRNNISTCGLYLSARAKHATGINANIVALNFDAVNEGNGNAGVVNGAYVTASQKGTGTSDHLWAMETWCQRTDGIASEMVGLMVDSNFGTTPLNIGIRIQHQAHGVVNYNLLSEGATSKNKLEGLLEVGGAVTFTSLPSTSPGVAGQVWSEGGALRIGAASGFANPGPAIGLAAVNGSSTNAMRADAAPALSQAIVPTWTGIHTWGSGLARMTSPRITTSIFDTNGNAIISLSPTASATTSLQVANAVNGGGVTIGVLGGGTNEDLYLAPKGLGTVRIGTARLHTTGTGNVFLGASAGNSTLTGTYSLGVGINALTSLTSGQYNTAVGAYALQVLNSGSYNVGLGPLAGTSLQSGGLNMFIGAYAGYSCISGSNNSAIGPTALYNASGSDNTGVGAYAGYSITNASNNTFIGSFAGYTDSTTTTTNNVTNATAIGFKSQVTQSNSLILGGVNAGLFVNVGIGTPAPAATLHAIANNSTINAVSTVAVFGHNATSGTPTANMGGEIKGQIQSSTTANQDAIAFDWKWINATHASRTVQGCLHAWDYNGKREALRWESDGAAPRIGFLGATAVVRQAGGVATAGASYSATEQGMIQKAYDCLRAVGLLT